MFYGHFADEGGNPYCNPNINNVEEDNRLSNGLPTHAPPPLTTGVFFNQVL
jgi:hypothetical protein